MYNCFDQSEGEVSELTMAEHYDSGYSEDYSQPRMTIIVYDEPQRVVVVPNYSKMMVPNVDPIEYSNRYDGDLLDFSTILDLCRQFNIPEHVIAFPTTMN